MARGRVPDTVRLATAEHSTAQAPRGMVGTVGTVDRADRAGMEERAIRHRRLSHGADTGVPEAAARWEDRVDYSDVPRLCHLVIWPSMREIVGNYCCIYQPLFKLIYRDACDSGGIDRQHLIFANYHPELIGRRHLLEPDRARPQHLIRTS